MSDTAAPPAPAPAPPAPAPAKGGKKKLVIAAVALVVLGAGAKATVLAPSADAGAEAAEAEAKGGELVQVEPMSVNLADGRYLQVGVAVELAEGVPAKEFEKKGQAAKMRDLVIATAAPRTVAELTTPEGRDAFKEQLRAGAEELYHEEFHDVYLTDLVMQ